MYSFTLSLHSIVRWLVVILGLVTAGRAVAGWTGKRGWETLDDQLGLAFTSVMDLQLLLGLLLYGILSPLTTGAFQNFGAAMSNSIQRFFAVEHIFLTVIGVVLAHLGRAMNRKATEASAKHKRAAIFFGLAILLILAAIPWPFLATGAGRPWLRLG